MGYSESERRAIRDATDAYYKRAGMRNPRTDSPEIPDVIARVDPAQIVNDLGAKWSPDFDEYAAGDMDVSQVRCVLCANAPCACPEFGTPEYFALVNRRHGGR